jgi:hypothetical protein
MLSWLLSLINPLNSIIGAISNTRIAQINASSEVEKAQLSAQLGALEAKRDALIADAGHSKIDLIVRAGLTFPLVAYFGKVILWDKVVGSWPNYYTDSRGPQNMILVYAVLGFYFLYSTARLFR